MQIKNTNNKKSVTPELWQISTETYDKIQYTEPETKARQKHKEQMKAKESSFF